MRSHLLREVDVLDVLLLEEFEGQDEQSENDARDDIRLPLVVVSQVCPCDVQDAAE